MRAVLAAVAVQIDEESAEESAVLESFEAEVMGLISYAPVPVSRCE